MKLRKLFRSYDIFFYFGILLIAFIISRVLILLGDPWTYSEWASNIIFAFLFAVMTALLGKRQVDLQDALATAALTEKIAVIKGATEVLRENRSGRISQLMIDICSGLNIFPFGRKNIQAEYLSSAKEAIELISQISIRSQESHINWSYGQWQSLQASAADLLHSFKMNVSKRHIQSTNYMIIKKSLEEICDFNFSNIQISSTIFFHKFGREAKNSEIRVQLNWNMLINYSNSHMATFKLLRHNHSDFIASSYYAPWYRDEQNNFCKFDSLGAQPIPIDHIFNYFDLLPQKSRDSIASIMEEIRTSVSNYPYKFDIVTLELNDHAFLVLDGNHRLSAVNILHKEALSLNVEINEYRINCDLSIGLLPDIGVFKDIETEQHAN